MNALREDPICNRPDRDECVRYITAAWASMIQNMQRVMSWMNSANHLLISNANCLNDSITDILDHSQANAYDAVQTGVLQGDRFMSLLEHVKASKNVMSNIMPIVEHHHRGTRRRMFIIGDSALKLGKERTSTSLR